MNFRQNLSQKTNNSPFQKMTLAETVHYISKVLFKGGPFAQLSYICIYICFMYFHVMDYMDLKWHIRNVPPKPPTLPVGTGTPCCHRTKTIWMSSTNRPWKTRGWQWEPRNPRTISRFWTRCCLKLLTFFFDLGWIVGVCRANFLRWNFFDILWWVFTGVCRLGWELVSWVQCESDGIPRWHRRLGVMSAWWLIGASQRYTKHFILNIFLCVFLGIGMDWGHYRTPTQTMQ